MEEGPFLVRKALKAHTCLHMKVIITDSPPCFSVFGREELVSQASPPWV